MRQSIFKRYLTITMAIEILSLVLLGGILMGFSTRYFRAEGKALSPQDLQMMLAFRQALVRVFLLASAIVLLVTLALVGLFAARQVAPLRQLSAAARSFGAGDFSVRVPVTRRDELGELAASFNSMANSLALSEGANRSFVANVSHELKTPMTTIAGFIDGILDGTIPREEQDKYLEVVSSEVKRLSRLVRSMLDLSRIDNGELKLKKESFDITQTLIATLLTFERQIEEKKIDIQGLDEALPQQVYGDQDLLHQVVYNLIENAVKFTQEGGWIRVKVCDSVDRVAVVIENSGPGIEAEELRHIFERFYKTDKSRSQDRKGMGLGLYIVKTILQRHGGDIAASSVPGESTRFEFSVPKPPQAKQREQGKDAKAKEPRNKGPKVKARRNAAERRQKDHE